MDTASASRMLRFLSRSNRQGSIVLDFFGRKAGCSSGFVFGSTTSPSSGLNNLASLVSLSCELNTNPRTASVLFVFDPRKRRSLRSTYRTNKPFIETCPTAAPSSNFLLYGADRSFACCVFDVFVYPPCGVTIAVDICTCISHAQTSKVGL